MFSVYVIEPFWTGVKHARFNSAFLKVLQECFPDDPVYFYGEAKHTENVRENLDGQYYNIKLNDIYLPYQDKKYKIPLLYSVSFIQSLKALARTPRGGLLIFSGMNPIVLVPLYISNLLLRRQFLIVAHGELSYLDKKVSKKLNYHYRLQAMIFRASFRRILLSKSVYFIVLGKFINKSLEEYISKSILRRKVVVMEHPYIFPLQYVQKSKCHYPTLNLAIIGLATRAKGSNKIITLYDNLYSMNLQDKVNLSIIGKVVDFAKELENTTIRHYTHSSFLNQEDYDRLIKEQDFILFFYPDETYKFTASGSFLDCLLHDKPIIAIRNSFFSYYMEKIGPIGYLTDTITEMADCIGKILNSPSFDCNESGKDKRFMLKQMRTYFSPNVIAQSLKEELRAKEFIKTPLNNR